ncbi:hypothetical protein J6590_091212 [Homalodisca vitripennis]|nr:hypothetical protein J6590_091212 [Homalodisca vitripennis]
MLLLFSCAPHPFLSDRSRGRSAAGKSAPEPDRRGKHMVRLNKTPAEVVGFVINHISSFPPEESHYSRH